MEQIKKMHFTESSFFTQPITLFFNIETKEIRYSNVGFFSDIIEFEKHTEFNQKDLIIKKLKDVQLGLFTDELNSINIPSWKEKYEKNIDISDGMSWTMTITLSNGEIQKKEGHEIFPPNYAKLIHLFEKYLHIDIQEFEENYDD